MSGAASGTRPASRVTWFGWERLQPGLTALLDRLRPGRLLLLVGPHSFGSSGAADQVAPLLRDFHVVRFERSEGYPTVEELKRGAASLAASRPELIIAIGGGGVMDLAKAMRVPFAVGSDGMPVVRSAASAPSGPIPLVAIPTTAGSGAEATRFSVVYVDGIKHSLDDPRIRPDFAIVDPSLTRSVSPRGTAVTGLDALAQGIESIWSVASTPQSRRSAERAVRLALRHLETAVTAPTREARCGMALAAHLAGLAIDTTRTTASHAASYPMTVRHGIPHGHAVGLTLPAMLVYNAAVGNDDVVDGGGVAAVRQKIGIILRLLGVPDAEAGRRRLLDLMVRIGLETSLAELGVHDADRIVAEGINPQRAGNNPRRITPEALFGILAQDAR